MIGSTGFIGRRMVRHLRDHGFEVETPFRDTADLRGRKLGHVIYAIGLTGNFRRAPQSTVEAHVTLLQKLLDGADFDSWLYLSSTRVYEGLRDASPATEDAALNVRPGLDAIYNLSKLLGESVCLAIDRTAIRVARLSNVYGSGQSPHSFLGSVIGDLVRRQTVMMGESCQSSKDYVSIDDVVGVITAVAMRGRERIYNVASGRPVTHGALASVIRQGGYAVDFAPDAPTRSFPVIDNTRISGEFGEIRRSILADLPLLIEEEARCARKDRNNE